MSVVLNPNYFSKQSELNSLTSCELCEKRTKKEHTYMCEKLQICYSCKEEINE